MAEKTVSSKPSSRKNGKSAPLTKFPEEALFSLPEKEQEMLTHLKERVDEKLKPIMEAPINLLNRLSLSVGAPTPEDIRTGNVGEDWSRISLSQIEQVLLAIPIYQFTLSSLEVRAWAEAELAKLLEKEYFEQRFATSQGSVEARKNEAYVLSAEERYRAFFLKYAYERIHSLQEGFSRICDRWARVAKLRQEELLLTRSKI